MGAFHGWINMLKPPGMTSHDVVSRARRLLGKGSATKVGHLGTLDPSAEGVLPLCVGKATRLSRFAGDCEKTYLFEIVFGIETDTLDSDGRIVRQQEGGISLGELEAVLGRFRGRIEQTPPQFSAVHHGGTRAYRLARRGMAVDLPSRAVFIRDLRLLDFRSAVPARALLEVVCSGGTYVRSLGAEIGKLLGCGAHLGFLLRKAVGRFHIEEAWTLEEVEEKGLGAVLLAVDWPLCHLPEVRLPAEQARRFCLGSAVEWPLPGNGEHFRVYGCQSGEMIGIGRRRETLLKPEVVLASAQNAEPSARRDEK